MNKWQITDNEASVVFNGSMNWLDANEFIFYQGGLDPASNHSFNFTNLGLQGQNHLTLSSVTLYNSRSQDKQSTCVTTSYVATIYTEWGLYLRSPSSVSALSTGAKAGIGVSVAVAVIALALAAAFFFLLRRHQHASSFSVSKSSSNLVVEPFIDADGPPAREDSGRSMGNGVKRHGEGIIPTMREVESPGKSRSQIPSTFAILTSTHNDSICQPITTPGQSSRSPLASPDPSTAVTEANILHSPQNESVSANAQDAHLQHQAVERIVELVARRMDPAGRMQAHEPPPEYQSQAGGEA